MIEVLVGMIASGKSTWARERARQGWLVMNDDAVVNMLHGGEYVLYDKDLRPLYKSIEDHVVHAAVLLKRDLVIDRGLDIDSTARKRWIALARSLDVPVRAVSFEVYPPEIHGERRFKKDARGHTLQYWIDVAEAHAKRYDYPSVHEGFHEVIEKKWECKDGEKDIDAAWAISNASHPEESAPQGG